MSVRSNPMTSYNCDNCNSHRRFVFEDENHQKLVNEQKSGLVTYSDIHMCKNNLLEVNNLSIDTNYNIRSYEKLTMPTLRMFNVGVPIPKKSGTSKNLIHLTQLPNNLELHMILRNKMIDIDIKIGRYDHTSMLPISTLHSDLGLIELEIFPTSISYTLELEQWFQELVRIIELLPPTSFGFLIETIRYIIQNSRRSPTSYDLKFMKTILASHEVHFELIKEVDLSTLEEKYNNVFGAEQLIHIERFVRILSLNKYSSIKEFTSNPRVDMELTSLIYLFHILEDEKIIKIEIPGILEE